MVGVVETIATGVAIGVVNHVLAIGITAIIKKYAETSSAHKELRELAINCERIQNQIGLTCDANWLRDVALLCYDVEDLLDKIHLRSRKKKEDFKLSRKSEGLIREFNRRLHEMLPKQLTTAVAAASSQPRPPEGGKCEFREEIKKTIVEELLGDGAVKNKDGSLGVTLILGVKGVGKTALADAIIKDARITSKFNCIKIPMASATDHFAEAKDEVIKSLRDQQPTKKLLILLDGLESVKSTEWDSFKGFLKDHDMKSKVLVTSRNPNVAYATGSSKHELSKLKIDECYALMKRYANSNENLSSEDRGALKHFEEKVGTKCYGLPLLAYRLGLLLSAQKEGQRLKKLKGIYSDDILILLKSEESLSDLLQGFLPFESCTQSCLAYCSLFPSDHDFEEADMVELWISEGIVQDSKHGLEKSAREYFKEIISHSIFYQQQGGYKMCNLFHDLAKQIVGEIGCGLVTGTPSFIRELKDMEFSRKRHVCLSFDENQSDEHHDISEELIEHIKKAERLRTFLLMGKAGKGIYTNPTFYKTLIYLRVLDLSHSSIKRLNISKLEHLRFLNLSFTPVESLGSLTNVFALRTLKLQGCKNLLCLPDEISKLTNLVCIEVKDADLPSAPPFIGRLVNLQTLDDFTVGNKEGYKLVELASLNSLESSLCIKKLENVESHTEATQAKLSDKKHLRTLELQWSDAKLSDEATRKSTFKVLEALQPPKNLATLRVTNYCGNEFPQWLGKKGTCDDLETLELRGCHGVAILPELAQLGVLKILQIHDCRSLTTLPSLEQLMLLKELEIDGCTNLEQLPTLPSSMRSEGGRLTIYGCVMLIERCQIGQDNWEMIKDIPNLSIPASKSPVPDERIAKMDHRGGSHVADSSNVDPQNVTRSKKLSISIAGIVSKVASGL